MYDRTPWTHQPIDSITYTEALTMSPTIPIAYPAASPDNPTDKPAPRCMKPLCIVSRCLSGINKTPDLLEERVGRWWRFCISR